METNTNEMGPPSTLPSAYDTLDTVNPFIAGTTIRVKEVPPKHRLEGFVDYICNNTTLTGNRRFRESDQRQVSVARREIIIDILVSASPADHNGLQLRDISLMLGVGPKQKDTNSQYEVIDTVPAIIVSRFDQNATVALLDYKKSIKGGLLKAVYQQLRAAKCRYMN